MAWQSIASSAQQSVLGAIPPKWQLSEKDKDPSLTDKTSVPRTCGLLTSEQLDITETTATELLAKLHNGTLSSFEVTEAFCGRAAIAHQLVCE
jgi:amidase